MSKISIPEVAKLVFIGFAVVDYKLFIQVSVILPDNKGWQTIVLTSLC